MRRMLLGIVAMFFVVSAFAHNGLQGPEPKPFAMDLGTQFTTLFVSCGTPVNPDCPRWNGPIGPPDSASPDVTLWQAAYAAMQQVL